MIGEPEHDCLQKRCCTTILRMQSWEGSPIVSIHVTAHTTSDYLCPVLQHLLRCCMLYAAAVCKPSLYTGCCSAVANSLKSQFAEYRAEQYDAGS